MEQKIWFNKILVIQSLHSNEVQTGANLYNDIIKRRCELCFEDLKSDLINVDTKQKLIDALTSIYQEASKEDMSPYLHFEIHGYIGGFQLNNGEIISWEELYPFISRINVATKNNLFISLASCFGATVLNMIDPVERVPFFAYVGAPSSVYTYEVEKDWTEYFDVLLTTRDFVKAIEALNKDYEGVKYVYMSSEMFWDSAIKKFLSGFNTRKERRKRHGSLLRRAKKDPQILSQYSHEQISYHLKKEIQNTPQTIERMKSYFFMRTTQPPF